MKIATWNVNALRARLDFVLHWLQARQPDVVGIQELKLTDEQFPHDEIRNAGYHAIVHGQKSWNGVAILSREPAEVLCTGLPGAADMGSRLVSARIGELTFTTVYVPNGKSVEHADYPRKLGWLDSLAEHFKQHHDPEGVEVLCGDFNVAPEPIDSWHEDPARVHHTPRERERIQALYDLGLVDLYREIHPDHPMFSWWDYRGGSFHRNLGLRIDLILGSAKVRQRTRSIEIDRDYRKKKDGLIASDHAPVILEITR
jgi:exodeoxyribonuclease-3